MEEKRKIFRINFQVSQNLHLNKQNKQINKKGKDKLEKRKKKRKLGSQKVKPTDTTTDEYKNQNK